MLRKRAFDAVRTDVLVVDAAESLETVAEKLSLHLEICPRIVLIIGV